MALVPISQSAVEPSFPTTDSQVENSIGRMRISQVKNSTVPTSSTRISQVKSSTGPTVSTTRTFAKGNKVEEIEQDFHEVTLLCEDKQNETHKVVVSTYKASVGTLDKIGIWK